MPGKKVPPICYYKTIMEQAHFLRDLVIVYGCGALVVYVFHKLRLLQQLLWLSFL